MLRKIGKTLIYSIEAIGILLLLTVFYFAYRLYSGPISIEKALPYIIESANLDAVDVKIDIDNANLIYESFSHPVTVEIIDVDIYDKNGLRVAKIPKMYVDFSLEALLKGQLLPKNVIVPFVHLNVLLTKDGRLVGYTETSEKPNVDFDIGKLMNSFLENNNNPYFETVELYKSFISVKYDDVTYELPDLKIIVNQNSTSSNINVEGLALVGVQGVNFTLGATYHKILQTGKFGMEISPFNPNLLQDSDEYEVLDMFNLSVGTKLEGVFDFKKFTSFNDLSFIKKLDFVLDGYNGVIRLPFVDKDVVYNVRKLDVEGSVTQGLDRLDVTKLVATTTEATGNANIVITGISDFIKNRSTDDLKIDIDTSANDLKNSDLKMYWPWMVGPEVRQWVHENIQGGVYDNAKFKIILGGDGDGGIEPKTIDGTVDVKNATVSYIDGMPSVTKANGYAHITLDKVDVFLKSGTTEGLKLNTGTLSFTKIREPQEYAEINLDVAGPLQNALRLIDYKPFEYVKEMDLDVNNISGSAQANVYLFFPLDEDLSVDKVTAKISAKMQDVKIKDVVTATDLTEGNLGLEVNNEMLALSGKGNIKGLPTDIIFKKHFTDAKYTNEYHLKAITSSEIIKNNYPEYAYITDFIEGEFPVTAVVKLNDDQHGVVNVTADLINTTLNFGIIGWTKESASSSILRIKTFITDEPNDINIRLTDRKDNRIFGDILFDDDGIVSGVDFEQIKGEKTNVAIRADFEQDIIETEITGKRLDMKGFLNTLSISKDKLVSKSVSKKAKSADSYIDIDVDELSFGMDNSYKNVEGKIFISDTAPDKVDFSATVGEQETLSVFTLNEAEGIKNYSLISEDAGENLKILDIIDNISGGKLNLAGAINDENKVTGIINVEDFNFEEAPTLVTLLSLASFDGILNSLQDTGVEMDKLEMPFSYENDILTISDAYTYGSGFGLTMWGTVNLSDKTLSIQGSIVPAYTLNRLLSHIPLFGNLFSSEKGSGLLNFSYKISGSILGPTITVNPLTALTPGMLKSIIDAGDSQTPNTPIEHITPETEAEQQSIPLLVPIE